LDVSEGVFTPLKRKSLRLWHQGFSQFLGLLNHSFYRHEGFANGFPDHPASFSRHFLCLTLNPPGLLFSRF
jgi:hypothetical protein